MAPTSATVARCAAARANDGPVPGDHFRPRARLLTVTLLEVDAPTGLISSPGVTVSAPISVVTLEPYRRELTAYCYRMLGSGSEAEDAVQETMVRAWRGRTASRAVRACARGCTGSPPTSASTCTVGAAPGPADGDRAVLAAGRVAARTAASGGDVGLPDRRRPGRFRAGDPAEIAEAGSRYAWPSSPRCSTCPARQRAALILCEVLRWQAAEAAELLDTSVAAVNSALQRARATLAAVLRADSETDPVDATAELLAALCGRLRALRHRALVTLLHDDAVQSMPPFAMWLQGRRAHRRVMLQPGPSACRGSRLLPTSANGCPAFGQYKPDPAGGWHPWALQVIEISEGKIAEMAFFLHPLDPERLFPSFGLPLHLDG